MKLVNRSLKAAVISAGVMAMPFAAQAVTLEITFTNTADIGGPTLTPVFTAVHNGSFDAFDSGSAASAAVEVLAEEGNPAGLIADLGSAGQSGVIFAPQGFAGAPLVEPGESASIRLDVDGSVDRYLSYMSMILPSNDQFIGNDDALAYELFDASGTFLGPQTFEITGLNAYDAGTELNIGHGAPFQGAFTDPAQDETGLIGAATGIDVFAGITLPNGTILDAGAISYAGNGDFQFATVSVEAVPVPAALPLMLGGLGLMGFVGRRRKQTA